MNTRGLSIEEIRKETLCSDCRHFNWHNLTCEKGRKKIKFWYEACSEYWPVCPYCGHWDTEVFDESSFICNRCFAVFGV